LKATIEKEEARIVRTAQETKEIERKQDAVRDEMYVLGSMSVNHSHSHTHTILVANWQKKVKACNVR
jgi:hypothetical protein